MKRVKSWLNIQRLFFEVVAVFFLITWIGCKKEITWEQQKSDFITKSGQSDPGCEAHFSYEGENGPAHWGDLCPDWALCGTGLAQSPVDIQHAVRDRNLQALRFEWHKTLTHIVNNGHTIQFNVDPGSMLFANGVTYTLLQFHFHHTSEHTIHGQYYPLEVHFVHLSMDGKLAVVGILFKKGHPNPLFTRFLNHFPHTEGGYSSDAVINLMSLLPQNQTYYNYQGSLTTPACSEMVNWHIIKGTVEASEAQIREMALIMHNNHRPLQPLNGRVIHVLANTKDGEIDD